MSVHLVTGYAGKEHVTSADAGIFNAGVIGTGKYVLKTGSMFAYEIINNNRIKIRDGDLINQGRHINIAKGDYEEVMIDNGLQSVKRHDLIVIRYSKNTETGVEKSEVIVIKGTSAANPVDPVYITGDLLEGATEDNFPLYRVKLNGISIEEIVPMFHGKLISLTAHTEDSGIHVTDGAAKFLKVNDIAEGANLNDIQTPGFYRCGSNAVAVALKNTPTANAFFMIVGRAHGAYQEIIEYSSAPKRYMRNYYFTTGWGPWQRIYSTADKPTASEVGAAPSSHAHNEISNTVISTPIYNNTVGTIIDFCLANIDTMIGMRITGIGYEGYDPIDCIYQFYNYSSGIISYSGIANGSPLTLKVFRHNGRCKGWVVQSRAFQTLQIAVTFGVGDSGNPTFTTGAMPTSGVTNLTDIIPKTSYHTGRKPTVSEIGAAATNHASPSLSYGGGTTAAFGHVKLSDVYDTTNAGSAASSIGASQLALVNAFTKLNKDKMYMYPTTINMGNANTAEKSIYFHSDGGVYPHRVRLYGGRSSTPTAFGFYDAGTNTSVLSYNDRDLIMTMGVGLIQVVFANNMPNGIKVGSNRIGYNPGAGGPNINFNTDNINLELPNGTKAVLTLNGEFRPSSSDSGTLNLGSGSGRWKQLFATTATISTSDKNLKDHVSFISEDERYETLFDLLEPAIYKLKNTNKEDNHDRKHMGLYAQDVENSLEVAGIDISEFAVLCKDFCETEEEYEVENEEGEIEKQTRTIKSDKIVYSLRYEELLPLTIGEVQKLKHKDKEMDVKISNLETELAEMKAEITKLRNLINMSRA